MKLVTILALDPGTGNYGYSILRGKLEKGKAPNLRVLKFGRLHTTVREIKQGLVAQVAAYLETLRDIHAEYGITHVVGERYQSRRMGGTTIESVNIMIGLTLGFCQERGIPCKFIPASQWKNEMSRNGIELEEIYAGVKPAKITPHAVDASSIGEYGAYILTGLKPFTDSVNESHRIKRFLGRAPVHNDIGEIVKKVKKRRVKRRVTRAGK
jgi:hypothetical protein